jgi:hypothetical protein
MAQNMEIKIDIPIVLENTLFLDCFASLAMTLFSSSLRGAQRRSNPGIFKFIEHRKRKSLLERFIRKSLILLGSRLRGNDDLCFL